MPNVFLKLYVIKGCNFFGKKYKLLVPVSDFLNLSQDDNNVYTWVNIGEQSYLVKQDIDTIVSLLAEANIKTFPPPCPKRVMSKTLHGPTP